jgi:hypothetical protein
LEKPFFNPPLGKGGKKKEGGVLKKKKNLGGVFVFCVNNLELTTLPTKTME